jgi:fatty acid synthase
VRRSGRSYIITGGLGGFGLALAVWLANRGAQHFVLTSKRGLRTGGQRKVIEMLKSRGCQVRYDFQPASLACAHSLLYCALRLLKTPLGRRFSVPHVSKA